MRKYLLAACAVALCPVSAFAQSSDYDYDDGDVAAPTARDGFRIEAQVAYENITDPEDDIIYELGQGVAFGGEVGFDIAVSDSVVVGPYASHEISTTESCDGDFCVAAENVFAAGLHVGFATGPGGQAYLKGGYSQLTISAQGTITDETGSFAVDNEETGGGFDFAFGYEQGFGENFYGRVEVGVGTSNDIFGFDFQRGTLGVALGTRF